jgi:cobalt-precorrin 5A hydrolase/precorrin-3B C17-methyltransferase
VQNNILQLPLHLHSLWVGIGCQRGSSRLLIATAIEEILWSNQLDQNAIAGIATIDTKASEVGLVEFCRLRNLPLKTFCAEVLRHVCVPNPAKIIDQQVGTPSVAEAATILAASAASLWTNTQQLQVKLVVPKQIFRLQGQLGAVTIAVAQAAH